MATVLSSWWITVVLCVLLAVVGANGHSDTEPRLYDTEVDTFEARQIVGLPSPSILPLSNLPAPTTHSPLPSLTLPSLLPTSQSASNSTTSSSSSSNNINVPAIVGAVVGGLAALSLAVGAFLFWLWRREKRRDQEEELALRASGDPGAPAPAEKVEKAQALGGAAAPQVHSFRDQATYTDAGKLPPPGRARSGTVRMRTSDPEGLRAQSWGYPEA
ncbi:uncharacterized protein PHACADRAFT_209873 [Phanerochaete carnosa HHB-10118-sp]|uniref:Mid2 domain-containing protein n=1 Tax=Phanerochaete carnosa (strain HHB-10118-sp) TaxID=650164 RepID=K5WUB8_PHACS|nr:uncharacterized protein PHACADRAFT_209873 [Phanerochaete carnosa HHB-10118-sp]EKM54047.1 hypothetical protein PHACADRAFT_209873 [Phanerochaete carnosa HHB-10118-sp]